MTSAAFLFLRENLIPPISSQPTDRSANRAASTEIAKRGILNVPEGTLLNARFTLIE